MPSIKLVVGVPPERDLQREVTALLNGLQKAGLIIDHYHRPSARGRGREHPGFLDECIAIRPGLVVAIEVKTRAKTSKTSPEQDAWIEAWGERGAVCRDIGEVRDALRRWGVVC